MPTVSALEVFTSETVKAGKLVIDAARRNGVAGAGEAATVLLNFGKRQDTLLRKLWGGEIKLSDYQRANESEREAVPLNLGAIANETLKATLQNLLHSSLTFGINIVAAALSAVA